MAAPAENETRTYEIDCGEAQYRLAISENPGGVSVLDLNRSPEQFSVDVRAEFKSLLEAFRSIKTIDFSCGAGPDEGHREGISATNLHEDFSGRVSVLLTGFHASDLTEAMRNCADQKGQFDPITHRSIRLSASKVTVDPDLIGRCYNRRIGINRQ